MNFFSKDQPHGVSVDSKGSSSRLVASPSIDLPKGGGSLKGIDEKFQSNPVTGSASFSIPLPLSPSRGFNPEIGLSYDSGSGNGPFGLGWSLSIPNISRKTDKGLPRYMDNSESDVFVMSGAEDLVPTNSKREEGDCLVRVYRPRIESGFAIIEQWSSKSTGLIHWRTISSDNTTRIYGARASTRISDPANAKRVFQWLLEFSHDGNGNAVCYDYEAYGSNRYLRSVFYGNACHYGGGDARPSDYHFELSFEYGDRPDPFSSYRSCFEIRCDRRCERILMRHKFESECLVRSIEFSYAHTDSDISLLAQAKQIGYNQEERKELPAMAFSYQAHEWNSKVRELDSESLRGLPAGLASSGSHFLDLYGEGLSGVLSESGRGWYYKRNLGCGRLGPLTALKIRPLTGSAANIQELEANSEKYLVDYAGDAPGFYRFEDGRAWTPHQPFKKLPNIDFSGQNVRTLDLDGDGRADILVDDDRVFTYYRSDGKSGFKLESQHAKPFDENKGPRIIFADSEQSVFLADMSGDGLTDIVRVRNGSVCYWPNLGHGKFGAKVSMRGSPAMDRPGQFSAARVRLADVDGSGAADLIYISADKVTVWLNKSGNGFTAEKREFALRNDNTTQISVLDFLGQGTACVVWSSPIPAHSKCPMRYIDLMGGKKPHLMTKYSNGMGKTVELEYTPSTKFYLDDRKARKPWVTKLPFPVHCLSRVVTHDHVSGHVFASSYSYHHGYYDIPEREFRGFGRVDQTDAESFGGGLDQDPVLTKTWFHLGAWIKSKEMLGHYEAEYNPVCKTEPRLEQPELKAKWSPEEKREAMRAFKGQPLRQEVYALDGSELEDKPYTTTQFSYGIRRLQAKGENRHACFHAAQSESLARHYERDIADPRAAHSIVLKLDKYGRPKLSAEVVYGRETNAAHEEQKKSHMVVTETKYAKDACGLDAFRMGMECSKKTWELTHPNVPKLCGREWLKDEFEKADEIGFEDEPAFAAAQKRLVEHAETLFYDKSFSDVPLPLGEMATHGLPYESYSLAYTPTLLAHLYGTGRIENPMLIEGGFEKRGNDWWMRTGRNIYDTGKTGGFCLPTSVENAFGARTEITYDECNLLVASVIDPLGNVVAAVNDYRTLSPREITDPNGNRTAVKTDALGIVAATAAIGKNGEGDTLDNPTAKMEYGFAVFNPDTGELTKPSWIKTSSREVHGEDNMRWLETIEYSDGMGRIALAKAKAEPGKDGMPRWVGTGRTVLNNKGNPVKQYEPYFSDTEDWESEEDAARNSGVTPKMHYDPLSRLVHTDFPDGTHSKVEFTAWEQADHDRCDTATSSPHHGTPTVTHLDSLGRPFCVIANDGNGRKPETRTVLDIEGNEKEIIAIRKIEGIERKICVMEYRYGMHGEKGYTNSMDAGERWMLIAADGLPTHTWDSRGHLLHIKYDALRRPTEQWLNDEKLVGKTAYGDSDDAPSDANMRGLPWKICDQSGMTENARFDFKGNLLESKRIFTKEYKQTINWNVNDTEALLQDEEFVSKTQYDAINRATNILTPHNDNIPASEIMPAYDEGGLLKGVKAKLRGATEETPFVRDINYNPKGQRTRIKYGNGATTKYTYDKNNFWLTSILTTRNNGTNALQDLEYKYDQMGNITEIKDKAQEVAFFDNQIVNPSQNFEYDALYRLVKATGREHADNIADMETVSEGYPNASPVPSDATALRNYTRKWEYDEVGNILDMIHSANNSSWNRSYKYSTTDNRLLSTSVGNATATYDYNPHGSMAKMPHLTAMEWDFAERLRHIVKGNGSNPTEAYYNYDGSGERTRKIVEKNNGATIEERLYLGGFEVYRKKDSAGTLLLERETLHIMDGFEGNEPEESEVEKYKEENNTPRIKSHKRRIAIVETKTWENSNQIVNPIPVQRYQFSNNIESATLELDETASIISYEEYYPYGDTSYQAGRSATDVSQKRYRYTGKEKDEESGLYYYGARYYSSMIGIFISVDPKFEKYQNVSSYAYCLNNPIKYIDPDGKEIRLEGDKEDKEIIFRNLQRLTNDKLIMHSDGTVIIAEESGKNTEKNLKVGSELIRALSQQGDGAKTVTIKAVTSNSYAYPADKTLSGNPNWANARNETGTNAIINVNIKQDLEVPTVNSKTGNLHSDAFPLRIILAHELIHAYNISKGIVPPYEMVENTYRANTDSGFKTETVDIDELYTIGISGYDGNKFTENKIREEQGFNLRIAYGE